ncbi:MAG TPA: OsmC family protein [Mycobacteriales bacterium]|jgi:organic hydroperoxide reductase OsmC/OhrA|nr:OsmC family protein [Mycobacteriales bacterium]
MARIHEFRSQLAWTGSTANGYRGYDRTHRVSTPPAVAELAVSADRAFRGDPDQHNPEQLLLAAASSCQLLSFLALAARDAVDVREYADDAEAIMPVGAQPMRITRVTLRPRILVAAGTDLALVRRLVPEAHDGCFIANTLNAEFVLEPAVEHLPATAGKQSP